MAINIYDSAKKIQKEDTTFFLIKCGSKNCFTYPYQRLVDNDLHYKTSQRETRESDWSCVAKTKTNKRMAITRWNCPTGSIYGRIQFGNKYNIALYLDRKKTTLYEELDDMQQKVFDDIVMSSENVDEKYSDSLLDLDKNHDIPEPKRYKTTHDYCGRVFDIKNYLKRYEGHSYWKCENL